MSHFLLGVLTRTGSEEEVERLLAPFQENNNGDCPDEYLAFNDTEDENRREYESGGTSYVVTADGQRRLPWDEAFRVPGPIGIGHGTHADPPGSSRLHIPYRETFATFENYMADWCGQVRDRRMGKYGYWENPNAKWDWWSIGGRWTGYLTGHEPQKDKRNWERCWLCRGTGTRPDMNMSSCSDGNEMFPVIGSGCNGCAGTGWKLKFPSDWLAVGNHAPVAALRKDFSPHALLTPDGAWTEKGEMIWFGIVVNEKPEADWASQVRQVLDKHSDCILVAVDCHI